MKSIIQEGSSVPNAITKAWNAAGNPEEFSVKVLSRGQRWVFGLLSKHPVIISMLYTEPIQKFAKKQRFTREDGRTYSSSEGKGQQSTKRYEASSKEQGKQKQVPSAVASRQTQSPFAEWTPGLINDVKDWLNVAMKNLSITIPFEIIAKETDLTVTFKEHLMDHQDERMLFSALAYLFLQSLKKKHKNKLRNFRIIFTTACS